MVICRGGSVEEVATHRSLLAAVVSGHLAVCSFSEDIGP